MARGAWILGGLCLWGACGTEAAGGAAAAGPSVDVPPSYKGNPLEVNPAPPANAATSRRAALSPSPGIPDPARDEVLYYIDSAVRPDDAQWEKLVALYRAFREEQAGLVAEYTAVMPGQGRSGGPPGGGGRAGGPPSGMPPRGERPAGGMPPRAGGRGGGGGGGGGGPGMLQQRVAEAREKFLALEAGFLADGRAVLSTAEQWKAWDECAASVNLAPPSTHGALDEAFHDPDAGPKVGEIAPDFTLRGLDGKPVSLSSFRGRPLVIQFGSYTCPAFREQATQLRPLVEGYGGKVGFLVVYGHEAHPTDGWVSQVNVREGIAIPSHTTWEERQKCALDAREALGLQGATVVVDELPDTTVRAWGGHPNTGYVLDAGGKVVSRQNFVNATETAAVLASLVR